MSPAPRDGFDLDEWEDDDGRTLFPLFPLFPHTTDEWPTIAASAFYGLPGAVVDALDGDTEADRVAVLVTYLTMFGAAVGRGPHALADGAEHPGRLYSVIVGETSKARKGTSYQQNRRIFAVADHNFTDGRILGGFGSGEALVDALAEDGDHRLLIVEPEWARILSVTRRDGSTLSQLLRQAWDGDRLAVRSRGGGKVEADGAHVGVVGHVTVEELRAKLTDTEVANGYANRHLLVMARRSKLLPTGGNLDDSVIDDFGRRTRNALNDARKIGRLRRTSEAEARWAELYYQMADDEPGGLVGAVIARDAAQVLRLSVVYALTDAERLIGVHHLEAAWAVWQYCRQSAAFIFGTATGNPIADKLLQGIEDGGAEGLDFRGMDRAMGGHVPGKERDAALDLLNRRGQVALFEDRSRGRIRHGAVARVHAELAELAEIGASA